MKPAALLVFLVFLLAAANDASAQARTSRPITLGGVHAGIRRSLGLSPPVVNSGYVSLAAPATPAVPVFSYLHIDEIHSGFTDPQSGLQTTPWDVYEDIMFPGTTIEWRVGQATTPSLDGRALECAITGGDHYNNIYCNTTIAKLWSGQEWPYRAAKRLVYSLEFYIDGVVDCQMSDNSTIEGLELSWQHVLIPRKHEFALQWRKEGEWRYWDATLSPSTGRPRGWISFPAPITSCLEAHRWHSIQLEGRIVGEASHYTRMTLDGRAFDLSSAIVGQVATPAEWHENFLQVSVQVNGNTALDGSRRVDPVSVYADTIRLDGFALNYVFLPGISR
ncbi:MAG: hypothetical protein M3R24_06290 [Chloroflexota bacterium]|nr:hypothetical protein [Chloroflexota bacterium]PLS80221.1 MAG: hypothetical protein CYG59_09160 [Chloroflexota bacterium]